MSVLMGGGRLKGGQVVGSTNRLRENLLQRDLYVPAISTTQFPMSWDIDSNVRFSDHGNVISERVNPAISDRTLKRELQLREFPYFSLAGAPSGRSSGK